MEHLGEPHHDDLFLVPGILTKQNEILLSVAER